MKLHLCFTVGLLTSLESSVKTVNIQIDPDDIIKIMNGVINSEMFKQFAREIVHRVEVKGIDYKNPYHPEDELMTSFADVVEKKEGYLQKSPKYIFPQIIPDSLDKENEKFLNRNDVANEPDVLTDEIGNPILQVLNDTKKIMDAVASKQTLTRKDGNQEHKDDRISFNPPQTRYELKDSDDKKI